MMELFRDKDRRILAEGLAIKEGRVVFFSHSLTTYHTRIEQQCLEFIGNNYRAHYIINPSELRLDKEWDYEMCMAHILPLIHKCKLLLYYKDGSSSPGVDVEIKEARKIGIPVIEINI